MVLIDHYSYCKYNYWSTCAVARTNAGVYSATYMYYIKKFLVPLHLSRYTLMMHLQCQG